MNCTPGTLVISTTRSLANPGGRPALRSVQAAQALSAILTEPLSSKTSEQIAILLALLLGITENTVSSDVLALAAQKAKVVSDLLGIEDESFEEVMEQFARFAQQARSWNPLAY